MQVDRIVVPQNMSLPGFADNFERSVGCWLLCCHVRLQPIEGVDDRLAVCICPETDVLDQGWQITTHGPVLGIQFPVVHVVGWPDQGRDAVECQCECDARNHFEQPPADLGIVAGEPQSLCGGLLGSER
jgi:hypothetical protein